MKTIGKNRTPVLASSVNFGGRFAGSQVFTDDGELNAGSKKDALAMIAAVLNHEGGIQSLETASNMEKIEAAAKEAEARREVLAACLADQSGITAAEVGAEMAAAIYQNAVHQGFMRSFMQYQPLGQGELPRVEIIRRDVEAAVLTGPTQAQIQVVRDYWLILPEVDVTVRLEIEGKRLNQSKEDLLQAKYNEGLESVLIQEDRMWKTGADAVIDSRGGEMASTAVGSIAPSVLKNGITALTANGMSPSNILFAAQIFGDVILDTGFGILIDPITRLEILKTGLMGTMFGARVLTDAVRDPRQKVLANNEIYLTAEPRYVGTYTDRGGVQSKPLSAAETSINGLGWHMVEYLGMGVFGERGISRIRLT